MEARTYDEAALERAMFAAWSAACRVCSPLEPEVFALWKKAASRRAVDEAAAETDDVLNPVQMEMGLGLGPDAPVPELVGRSC